MHSTYIIEYQQKKVLIESAIKTWWDCIKDDTLDCTVVKKIGDELERQGATS